MDNKLLESRAVALGMINSFNLQLFTKAMKPEEIDDKFIEVINKILGTIGHKMHVERDLTNGYPVFILIS